MEIEDAAFGPVRSFLAEYVVAAWREAQGGSPILLGGRRRGHDIRDQHMLIDAKILVPTLPAERRAWPGHDWKVARDRHARFAPDKTTHIALVVLPDDMSFELVDDDGKVSISTSYQGTAIFLATVDDFNDLLDPETGASERWRYLFLESSWLNERRVR